jgi:glycine oxidase
MKNVAVVGAGLMGRLSALSLCQKGLNVTLFDKDDKKGELSAARAAGGLLTPLGESLTCDPWIVEMGLASLSMWPQLLQTLDDSVFFEQTGAVVVAHAQDSGEMHRFNRHHTTHWSQYPGQMLDREQLQQLEPQLSHSFQQGLYLPQEGQICNRQLLKALQHQLEKEGVEWHCQHPVDDVHQLQQSFDLVIDCRGVGASKEVADLRGVRGELFQLLAPEVKLNRPIRLMHPRYQLYIAPKPDHYYVVGATEIESDNNSPMTVRSALELLSAAYSVHTGFAEATIVEHVSQCRPAFNDNHPQIRVSDSLIQVNGLYRHGFLLAPMVLEHLMQVVDRMVGATPVNNDNYLNHFSEGLTFAQLIAGVKS